MKVTIGISLALFLAIIPHLPMYARPLSQASGGTIIFSAWWDSNHDGTVTTDTDTHSLFRLQSNPGAPVSITPITQQPAETPLIRADGSVPFYLDRGKALHSLTRIITREPVLDSAYTPDGTRLVLLTQPAGVPYRALSVVDVRTGILVQFTGANTDDSILSLAPDGARVLFTQTIFGVSRLYLADIRSGAITPLTDGSFRALSPRWSPNGGAIAYVRQIDNNRNGYDPGDPKTLWLSDGSGISQRQLSPAGAVDAGAPLWSTDGTHIAFLHRTDNDNNRRISPPDTLQLGVVNVTTGNVNLVSAGAQFPFVQWNPTGSRLAFLGITNDTNGDGALTTADVPTLWIMGADDVIAAPFSGSGQVAGGGLSWSPDGNRFAYTIAVKDDNADGQITAGDATQLYIADMSGGLTRPAKPLLDGPRLGSAAWSPAGDAIALVARTDNSLGALIRVNAADGTVDTLSDQTVLVDSAAPIYWLR